MYHILLFHFDFPPFSVYKNGVVAVDLVHLRVVADVSHECGLVTCQK